MTDAAGRGAESLIRTGAKELEVSASGANLIGIPLHQIFKAERVAGGCDEAIT